MTRLRGSIPFALLLLVPAPAASQEAQADFSTPEKAVTTFIAAVAARDVDLVARSFSPAAAGEFEPLLEKRLSDEDWDQLQEMFDGATVLETISPPEYPDRAVVRVQLREGQERLSMVQDEGRWWIVDF